MVITIVVPIRRPPEDEPPVSNCAYQIKVDKHPATYQCLTKEQWNEREANRNAINERNDRDSSLFLFIVFIVLMLWWLVSLIKRYFKS